MLNNTRQRVQIWLNWRTPGRSGRNWSPPGWSRRDWNPPGRSRQDWSPPGWTRRSRRPPRQSRQSRSPPVRSRLGRRPPRRSKQSRSPPVWSIQGPATHLKMFRQKRNNHKLLRSNHPYYRNVAKHLWREPQIIKFENYFHIWINIGYICKRTLSAMLPVKSRFRSRLTGCNLQSQLHCAVTHFEQ